RDRHNGLNRLFGGGGPAQGGQAPPANPFPAPPSGVPPPGAPPPGNGPGVAGGPTGEIGQPGVLRLLVPPLSNEIGWLLPFGLASIILVALATPLQMPLADQHKSLILWGGWLLTAAVFFSVAEFYHAYYLVMIGAPLAALVAMGLTRFWAIARRRPAFGWGMLALSALLTVVLQAWIAADYVDSLVLAALSSSMVAVGVILMTISLINRDRRLQAISALTLVSSMLMIPFVWSVMTTLEATPNVPLPSAYGDKAGPRGPVERSNHSGDPLLAYLLANTQDVFYLAAVPSSHDGSQWVIDTGQPVLYMGGFNGRDPVVGAEDLQARVDAGDLRYILLNGAGSASSTGITGWVRQECVLVDEPVTGGRTLYRCD
ncbi:MAG: hypothetical protein GYB68_02980, partial [Chloroflexi bacterium]|nr:hypothetical protein [Chloroflexota bacterium]